MQSETDKLDIPSWSELEDPSQELLERILTDKFFRLNCLYHVRNKSGRIVPFRMNDAQERLFFNHHNRNIIPKARQKGITTYEVIDSLDDCLFNSNFEAGIIAHTLDDAKKIFEKAKLAFKMLPEWLKKHRVPNTDAAGVYVFPNGSSFMVDTSFRSGTLSRLHVSELGKIARKHPEKAKEIVTGAFEAVPIDGRIDVESTAEGMDGEFYWLVDAALKNDPEKLSSLDFKLHFEPWWTSFEYVLNPVEIDVSEYEQYFKILEDDHGIKLSPEQKAWYTKKAQTLGDHMPQEYPSFLEEAFLSSGRPFFNNPKLVKDIRKAQAKKPLKGFVTEEGKWREDPLGNVLVWHMPDKSKAYAIGADVAEGLEDGDDSTVQVVNKDYQQCARYIGKIDPDTFGRFLVGMAKFFNTAILAPEINNHGHATLAAIKNAKYYKVFKREVQEELGKDIQDKVGWQTNTKTKTKMADDLNEVHRDNSLEINDELTLREMMTVSIDEYGVPVLNGKDLTVGLAIAVQALRQASIGGENKAFVPGKSNDVDVTKLDIKAKIDHFNRMAKR
jgi:hypothetical protein